MRRATRIVVGLLALAGLAAAEARGWTPMRTNEALEPVPTSIRDNPGAYRAMYISSGRYRGGK